MSETLESKSETAHKHESDAESEDLPEFREYMKVIYGWDEVDYEEIYKILTELKLLKIDEDKLTELKRLQEDPDEYEDAGFDYVFNSNFLEDLSKINRKETYIVYNHQWTDGLGLYFGLNIRCKKVGNYGEPRFGSLIMNKVSLTAINDMVNEYQETLDELTKLFGKEPSMFIISKGY